VNSEELERSLRSEFENYLKGVRDEMRQKTAELESKLEAEIDNHRSTLAEALKTYSQSIDSEQYLDDAFKSSVLEHLRLARDEGSKLAATAMVEAEEMEKESASAPAPADYAGIRDALNDISSHDSQSAILKSLVEHSAEFAPRGAFFIVKNEQFVGWKVFGADGETAETAIRDVSFPVAADTVVGNAVRSLSTKEGSFAGHGDDHEFLDPLQFGQPDRMYAIPLVARGRGVAVMYVDYGAGGVNINVEALETLVRMAGLTVELLAANQTASFANREAAPADFEDTSYDNGHQEPAYETQQASFEETPAAAFDEGPQPAFDHAPAAFDETPEPAFDEAPTADLDEIPHAPFDSTPQYGFDEPAVETASEYVMSDDHSSDQTPEYDSAKSTVETSSEYSFGSPADAAPNYDEPYGERSVQATSEYESGAIPFDETQAYVEPQHEYQPEPSGNGFATEDTTAEMPFEPAQASPFDTAATPEFEPAVAGVGAKAEASIEVSPSNTGYTRLSSRPVDLPIEVAEDERRLHNDARRFARLLVSEIKLYNEKKVQEGRQERDLYERLREAIDRSREMYDKRVQPPVAAKFDYFHFELVNALADGEAERLGSGYPGSKI